MEGNDKLIAIFIGILKALDTVIAMHHVMVAQPSFYIICAVQFLARLSPMCPWSVVWQAGGQETWLEHGIEMSGSCKEMHGIFLHERLTQRIKNPIQNVDLRQCATTIISSSKSSVAICTNAL